MGMQSSRSPKSVAKDDSKICLTARLEASPETSKPMHEAAISSGRGYVSFLPDGSEINLDITWDVPGNSANDPVIGIHIHQGDDHQNGAILVGFCGESPLPTFTEKCEQGKVV